MTAGTPVTNPTKPIHHALLMAAGPLDPEARAVFRDALQAADMVVGIDGGAETLHEMGVVPDIVTGDFDSLPPDLLCHLTTADVRIIPTPDQNFTDLDKAVSLVLTEYQSEGLSTIDIFGATGGRLDHIYGALSTVTKYGKRIRLRLIDGIGATWRLNESETLTGHDLPGRTLSLLAMGRVEGIRTTGLRWELSGEWLAPGLRDGTSNEIVAETVTLQAELGDLLVMLHHAAPSIASPREPGANL